MKKWTPLNVGMMIGAVMLGVWLFIIPELKPHVPNIISEKDLVVAGVGVDGYKLYYGFKEAPNPVEKFKPFIPVIVAALPFIFGMKKKEGG